MPVVSTHADAICLGVSSVEIQHLVAAGTVPGVAILAAAARNGPGTGRLRSTGDGTHISWRAPGSATFGTPATCSADGSVLLEDGEDRDKWVRVQVWAAYLRPGPAESQIQLRDVYAGGTSEADLTAVEAAAGDIATYEIEMENVGTVVLSDVRAWLHGVPAGSAGYRDLFALLLGWHSSGPKGRIELSDDGSTWIRPADEDNALEFPDLAPGATDILHVRRTIGGGVVADAGILDQIHLAFNGL